LQLEKRRLQAMSRVDHVTAEPRMDDLLASIRRAIHDEGLDILEADDVSVVEVEESGKGQKAIAPTSMPAVERPQEDNSNEIINLRNKIARELNKDLGAPHLTVVPAPRLEPVSPGPRTAPGFRSLLGGEKTPRAIPPDAPASQPKPVSRAAAVPNAPRRPQPVHAVRLAHDGPSRSGASFRPPFGQSSMGMRSLQPQTGNDGMISPETSHVTANSFTRLAEQVFGREEGARSIDDLARELLHPMLKQWLDENLPQLVERLVREEIERVARRGRR
jgi:cell pole-organizing protein PopZ